MLSAQTITRRRPEYVLTETLQTWKLCHHAYTDYHTVLQFDLVFLTIEDLFVGYFNISAVCYYTIQVYRVRTWGHDHLVSSSLPASPIPPYAPPLYLTDVTMMADSLSRSYQEERCGWPRLFSSSTVEYSSSPLCRSYLYRLLR